MVPEVMPEVMPKGRDATMITDQPTAAAAALLGPGGQFEIVDADLLRVKRLMIRQGGALADDLDETEGNDGPDPVSNV